ncbi:MAG: PQQ-binding-like beta-propeller repeat protein [Phycisphaerae bacterium]
MRRYLISAAIGGLVCSFSAHAAEILVGGPQGVPARLNLGTGEMQFIGSCGDSIAGISMVGGDMFIAGVNGSIYDFDVQNSVIEQVFDVTTDISTMVAHKGQLWIASEDGTIRRVSPTSGQVLNTYSSPEPVWAVTAYGDHVYATGPNAAIYRASDADGVFSYFTCSCFPAVNSITATDQKLYLVTTNNQFWTIDRANGQPLAAWFLPFTGTAVQAVEEKVIIGGAIGQLITISPESGDFQEHEFAPVQIEAIALFAPSDCLEDLSGDESVDLVDLSILLAAFGPGSGGDINGDAQTDLTDLSMLLASFGTTCE